VTQSNTVKYMFKANTSLVIRMHFDHDYSAEDICLRLRYDIDNVCNIIERYKTENDRTQFNNQISFRAV
jgi:hypothetical protein